MKFYDREKETKELRQIEDLSVRQSQLTYIMGRRRIGKTALVRHAFTRHPTLYFFVSKKTEVLLCEEFVNQAEQELQVSLGTFTSFAKLFRALMLIGTHKHFTLVIDEFQSFIGINQSIYSEMQNVWDELKDTSHVNVVCCGSMFHLMKKIFEDHGEPLYGRATNKMVVKPFDVNTLKTILKDHNPRYKSDDLLCLYMLTGGVAKYVELLMGKRATSQNKMLSTVVSENSYFLTEGHDILVDEFGRDYATYFSILSLIAQSKTTRGEIESVLGIETGGYLNKLETWYGLISRNTPFRAKSGGKVVRYRMMDKFLTFWFCFVYKYRSSLEIGNIPYVAQVVKENYETYSGRILEDYFKDKLALTKKYSEIGSYWNRKGESEIDIVTVDEKKKTVTCIEVKRQAKKLNLATLKQKMQELKNLAPGYTLKPAGLTLDEM